MFGLDNGMFGRGIGFDSPGFLFLLLLLPLLWIWSFKSLAGLGPARRIFALVLRTVVFTLLVLALANTQLRRSSETMTVIYLLDQSASRCSPWRFSTCRRLPGNAQGPDRSE